MDPSAASLPVAREPRAAGAARDPARGTRRAPRSGCAGCSPRRARRARPGRALLPGDDERAVELELRDPLRRVAARPRRGRARREGRVGLLLAERPRQGRPGAAGAAPRRTRRGAPAASAGARRRGSSTAPPGSRRSRARRCRARASGARRCMGESRTDPALLVTTFRSDPAEYPRARRRASPGSTPAHEHRAVSRPARAGGRSCPRGPMEVPPRRAPAPARDLQQRLQARATRSGGWALGGHTYAPMRNGQATFVRYRDGRFDVSPGTAARAPALVVVRAPEPAADRRRRAGSTRSLTDGAEWGATRRQRGARVALGDRRRRATAT